MSDLNFLLQNQNGLLITQSNFPILYPLDIFEHFAAVHFHLKWLKSLAPVTSEFNADSGQADGCLFSMPIYKEH